MYKDFKITLFEHIRVKKEIFEIDRIVIEEKKREDIIHIAHIAARHHHHNEQIGVIGSLIFIVIVQKKQREHHIHLITFLGSKLEKMMRIFRKILS